MAKRGGYPGGMMPGNMNNMLKQAQRMQRQMEESQKAMETKEFTATAGGGAVTSLLPVRVTETAPPPAVAVNSFVSIAFWLSSI